MYKTKEEAFRTCQAEGFFRKLSMANKQRIRSLARNADTNIQSAETLARELPKQDSRWMNVYTLHYEAVRIYAEAAALFDKITSQNHQCLFAYLCVKQPELKLEWNFLEQIRRKRNGVNYYGESISYTEWKTVEERFKKTLSALKEAVEKKMLI